MNAYRSLVPNIQVRLKAAGLHFLLSGLIAVIAGSLVFGLWYPSQYRNIAGGRELFILVISIDVILGPLLTLTVFDIRKGWPHLRRDLAVIAVVQVAALAYGLHTVYIARPVALVFEGDRFRVVNAAEVYQPDLPKTKPEYQSLPLTGPWVLGTRASQNNDEEGDAQLLRQLGAGVGMRPMYWRDYEASRSDVVAKSKPLAALLGRQPAPRQSSVREDLRKLNVPEAGTRYLPLAARGGPWVVLLSPDGRVLGFEALDGDS